MLLFIKRKLGKLVYVEILETK